MYKDLFVKINVIVVWNLMIVNNTMMLVEYDEVLKKKKTETTSEIKLGHYNKLVSIYIINIAHSTIAMCYDVWNGTITMINFSLFFFLAFHPTGAQQATDFLPTFVVLCTWYNPLCAVNLLSKSGFVPFVRFAFLTFQHSSIPLNLIPGHLRIVVFDEKL